MPTAVDIWAAEVFEGMRSAPLESFMTAITRLGDAWLVSLLAVLLVAALWRAGRRRDARVVSLSLLAGVAIADLGVKYATGRLRPPAVEALIELPRTPSLPSGHAFATLLFAGLLVYVARVWTMRAALAVVLVSGALVGLVGVSRVYLGVHWATDVFAGWALALFWLALTVRVARSGAAPRGSR